MMKSFKIGDKVTFDESEFPFLGLPEALAGATLSVVEFAEPLAWMPRYELADSDGNHYAVLENAIKGA